MGCGSPLGDLFYLADALLYGSPVSASFPAASAPSSADPSTHFASGQALRAQLYQLYGEGQVTEEVFAALRALADGGQLRSADLAVHRVNARRRGPAPRADVEVSNALRAIRARLAGLDETRRASEQVLGDLKARLADLDRRIAEKDTRARESVQTDEQIARARLTEKTELAASRERLAVQAEALRADLSRLDDVCAQLEAKASELEAVHARGRVAQEVSQ